ncbi:uncharacterized protein LOC118432967 isoform X2 [Folsomia candida]|uniref:uncharacterized protein LOC118432967 isoform X2 n=1 Tax=Folsomia candida TaxID=158441 RepID=UPI001604CC34|nr:uncharacterized protein LOC118432967 isoform X2 [Folsomia candida]
MDKSLIMCSTIIFYIFPPMQHYNSIFTNYKSTSQFVIFILMCFGQKTICLTFLLAILDICGFLIRMRGTASNRSKNTRNSTSWLRRLRPRLNFTKANSLGILTVSKKKQRIDPPRSVEINTGYNRKHPERLFISTEEKSCNANTIIISGKELLNNKLSDLGKQVLPHRRNVRTRSQVKVKINIDQDSLENLDPSKKYKNNDPDCHKVRKLKDLDRHLKLVHASPATKRVYKTHGENKNPSEHEARKENRSLTNKLADFNCTPKRVLFPENRPLLRSCNKPATPPQEIPANPSDKGGKKSFVSENEPHLKTKSNKGKTRKPPRIIRTTPNQITQISFPEVEPMKFMTPIIPRTFLKISPRTGPNNSSTTQFSQSQSQHLYCDFLHENVSQSCPPTQHDPTKGIRRRVFLNNQANGNQGQALVSHKSQSQEFVKCDRIVQSC